MIFSKSIAKASSCFFAPIAGVACVVTLVNGGEAQALVFSFGGSSLAPRTRSLAYEANGIPVTVTAANTAGEVALFRDASGIGAFPSGDTDPEIDGNGSDELLRVNFGSKTVTLRSITFARVGANDLFTLFVDGTLALNGQDIPGGNATDTDVATLLLNEVLGAQDRTGSQFIFTLPNVTINPNTGLPLGGGSLANTSDYLLSSVDVAVPEPLTLGGTILFGGCMSAALKKKLSGFKKK